MKPCAGQSHSAYESLNEVETSSEASNESSNEVCHHSRSTCLSLLVIVVFAVEGTENFE